MAHYELTPGLGLQIASLIRSGCFVHVAAEANGVPRQVLDHWLKQGEAKDGPEAYAWFADEIRTATAQARMRAEHHAFTNDPRAWLEHGPGRDRPGDPGWTSSTRPGAGLATAENVLANPELMDFLNRLLEALEKFPDAHAHVVQMIAAAEFRKKQDQEQGDSHDPSPSPVSQERI